LLNRYTAKSGIRGSNPLVSAIDSAEPEFPPATVSRTAPGAAIPTAPCSPSRRPVQGRHWPAESRPSAPSSLSACRGRQGRVAYSSGAPLLRWRRAFQAGSMKACSRAMNMPSCKQLASGSHSSLPAFALRGRSAFGPLALLIRTESQCSEKAHHQNPNETESDHRDTPARDEMVSGS
jgi:hypothetical protein